MSQSNNYKEYYEKPRSNTLTDKENERIKNIMDLIPNDITSVIEVGCGDGRLINRFKGKYKLIYGMDISEKILKKVNVPKVVGSIDNIPFADNSFDIVICSEVLEHLPVNIYKKSLTELERISNKYILVSVPDNENIEVKNVKCPQCSCTFHPWRHLRSYKIEDMDTLFTRFKPYKTKTFSFNKDYPDFLVKYYKIFKNISKNSEIPGSSVCPQCGYFSDTKINGTNRKKWKWKNYIQKFLLVKKGGWIISLYKNDFDLK